MLHCWKEPVLGSCRRRGKEWVETAHSEVLMLTSLQVLAKKEQEVNTVEDLRLKARDALLAGVEPAFFCRWGNVVACQLHLFRPIQALTFSHCRFFGRCPVWKASRSSDGAAVASVRLPCFCVSHQPTPFF